jgi:hypothetical protein
MGLHFLFFCITTYAQKASDVLENGIRVKKDEKIFLRYFKGQLQYDNALSLVDATHPPDFTPLEDSAIFLAEKNAINVYVAPPLNPLNFSISTEIKWIPDPIDEEAKSALVSIIDVVNSINPAPGPHAAPSQCDRLFANIESIQSRLADNKKKEINEVFKALKSLSFLNEPHTRDSISIIRPKLDGIKKYFDDTQKLIDEAEMIFNARTCTFTDTTFMIRWVITKILKEASELKLQQEKRYKNVEVAFDMVRNVWGVASTRDTGLQWSIDLPAVPSEKGKIYIYNITIRESGYTMSDKEEIVAAEEKTLLTRTIRVRKFQRFVPEAAVGIAYTNFKYYTYGVTTDSLDMPTEFQHVASPTEHLVDNINLTTTLNFNYFIPNSPIHPLYQLGVGVNGGMPTLVTGIGIRSNINGVRRLAVSCGIAMTWIKTLDTLKVGDVVSGTAEIDEDLRYEFTKPKLYIGLQYNF